MSTVVCKVAVRDVDKRFTRDLLQANGSFDEVQNLRQTRTSIRAGETVAVSFTKFCVAYFPQPTLIQLTIGDAVSTPVANGTLVLPFAGSISVTHPGDAQTNPIELEFLSS